jgi:hypothetical protein
MGKLPVLVKGNFPLVAWRIQGDTHFMSFDPFVAGLRAYFAANPHEKPSSISVKAGLDASVIRKMVAREDYSPKVSTARKIAAALGMTVDDLANGAISAAGARDVSIAGSVSAGDGVELVDVYEPGAGRAVRRPEGLPTSGIVAVEVSGDSMEPIYSDGDVLFYSRPTHDAVPSEAMGRKCICVDHDGNVWVKLVKPGEKIDFFHLIAINPTSINRFDVALKWAAPVILHWPKELAKFIEQ